MGKRTKEGMDGYGAVLGRCSGRGRKKGRVRVDITMLQKMLDKVWSAYGHWKLTVKHIGASVQHVKFGDKPWRDFDKLVVCSKKFLFNDRGFQGREGTVESLAVVRVGDCKRFGDGLEFDRLGDIRFTIFSSCDHARFVTKARDQVQDSRS